MLFRSAPHIKRIERWGTEHQARQQAHVQRFVQGARNFVNHTRYLSRLFIHGLKFGPFALIMGVMPENGGLYTHEPNNIQSVYRGIWANRLENGDELPVGGSIFTEELTTKLVLNFDEFGAELDPYRSPEKVSEAYQQNREQISTWLRDVGSTIDPYLIFALHNVQRKVFTLMNFNPENSRTQLIDQLERATKYHNDIARLTDFRGFAMCAELAALGQHLLQNVLRNGYSSSYMSGVEGETSSANGDHSFIVIRAPDLTTYIFDIARPISDQNMPRILRTDVPFTHELFRETNNLLIGATEVLRGGRLYFGLGNPWLCSD